MEQEEVRYLCERCGYKTNVKCNMIKHLKRKIICPCVNGNSSREELLQNLESTKTKDWQCTICDECFASKSTMYRHKKNCERENENKRITELEQSIKELQRSLTSQSQVISHSNIKNSNITNNNNNIKHHHQ